MWYTIEQRFKIFISHDQIIQSIQTWCQIKANHLINLLTKFQHSIQHHPRVMIKNAKAPNDSVAATIVQDHQRAFLLQRVSKFSRNASISSVKQCTRRLCSWWRSNGAHMARERERETNASRSHTLSSQIIIFHLCTFPPNQKKMFIFELVFPFSSPPKVETFSSKNSAKNFNYFARKFIKSWTIFTEIFYSFP